MLASALQLIAAFDLVCTGTMRSGPLGLALPEQDGAPIATVFHVDLEGRLWCSDACDAPERIADVNEAEIMLREQHHPAGGHFITISRATGRFADTRIAGSTAVLRSGKCEAAPFTGFPARRA